ncbi:MAG: hypothetical protein AB1898_09765 [Acidobacteriota bacterium]
MHRRSKTCHRLICTVAVLLALASSAAGKTSAAGQTDLARDSSGFRLEVVPVDGGAELLTIFGDLGGDDPTGTRSAVPLVSILRDTLGSPDNDVHRLRYVWVHTYTHPSWSQKAAAAVPFFYSRFGNKKDAGDGLPPPLLDLTSVRSNLAKRLWGRVLQYLTMEPHSSLLTSSARSYRRNVKDYREAQIRRALSILMQWDEDHYGFQSLTEAERRTLEGRFLASEGLFRALLKEDHLEEFSQQRNSLVRRIRARNWELLRQRAESEGLYFEPLRFPDGTATHAMLWTSRSAVQEGNGRPFNGRFLNIASPWDDKRLNQWQGVVSVRNLDLQNRPCNPEQPDCRREEWIPLAIYGLEHPKIPILLVDFRAPLNPKRREIYPRAVHDVSRDVLSVTAFGNFGYWFGRSAANFVTRRVGKDFSQPSRLCSISQLKLLLPLHDTLAPDLVKEILRRLEKVSVNPLENNLNTELQVARAQYRALLHHAGQPDGLPAILQRDRREEITRSHHGALQRGLLNTINVLSFGLYAHREREDPELAHMLAEQRRVEVHTQLVLRAARSVQAEIDWDPEQIQHSLEFLSQRGKLKGKKLIAATQRILSKSADPTIRMACQQALWPDSVHVAALQTTSGLDDQGSGSAPVIAGLQQDSSQDSSDDSPDLAIPTFVDVDPD